MRLMGLLLLLSSCGAEPLMTARITSAMLPETAEAARLMGCFNEGAAPGVGLGSLAMLAGGLEQYLKPVRSTGEIPLLQLITPTHGSLTQAGPVTVMFEKGTRSHDGIIRRQAGYEIILQGHSDGVWFEIAGDRFVMPIPLLSDLILDLEFNHASISGRAEQTPSGLTIREAVLDAYLDEASLLQTLQRVKTLCNDNAPPAVCLVGDSALREGTSLQHAADLFLSLVGGYDVSLDENRRASPCEGAACNGLSLCLSFTAEPVTLK